MKESTKEEIIAGVIGVVVVVGGLFIFFALNMQSYANKVASKLAGKAGS